MAIRIWICPRCLQHSAQWFRFADPMARASFRWKSFISVYYETVLQRGELIESVRVPPLNGAKAAYTKVTSRSADDWPAINIGVRLEMDGDRIRTPASSSVPQPTKSRG